MAERDFHPQDDAGFAQRTPVLTRPAVAGFNPAGGICRFRTGGIEWLNAVGGVTSSISIQVSVNEDSAGGGYLRFLYTRTNGFTKEKADLDYQVQLVTTPCHFGGVRYWFVCPLVVKGNPCARRVAKLHLPPGEKYFGCRHCHNLTYRCQKEHDKRVDVLVKNPAMFLSRMKN